jgi:hypothetical protein
MGKTGNDGEESALLSGDGFSPCKCIEGVYTIKDFLSRKGASLHGMFF